MRKRVAIATAGVSIVRIRHLKRNPQVGEEVQRDDDGRGPEAGLDILGHSLNVRLAGLWGRLADPA